MGATGPLRVGGYLFIDERGESVGQGFDRAAIGGRMEECAVIQGSRVEQCGVGSVSMGRHGYW